MRTNDYVLTADGSRNKVFHNTVYIYIYSKQMAYILREVTSKWRDISVGSKATLMNCARRHRQRGKIILAIYLGRVISSHLWIPLHIIC